MTEISAIIARCRDRTAHSKAKLASSTSSILLNVLTILPLLQKIDEGYDELDKMMKGDVTPEQEEKIKQMLSTVEQTLDALNFAVEMFAKVSRLLNSLIQNGQ